MFDMKENLNLQEIINDIQLGKEELPLIAEELIRWKIINHSFMLFVYIGFLVSAVIFAKILFKRLKTFKNNLISSEDPKFLEFQLRTTFFEKMSDRYYWEPTGSGIFIIIVVVVTFLITPFFIVSQISELIQLITAPKIYIIEYIRQFIR